MAKLCMEIGIGNVGPLVLYIHLINIALNWHILNIALNWHTINIVLNYKKMNSRKAKYVIIIICPSNYIRPIIIRAGI